MRRNYATLKPVTLLFSHVVVPSAPPGFSANPRYNLLAGLQQEDMGALAKAQQELCTEEKCRGPLTFAARTVEEYIGYKQELLRYRKIDAAAMRKAEEELERVAEDYKQYAGILRANSAYSPTLGYVAGGKLVDLAIPEDEAAKDKLEQRYFASGTLAGLTLTLNSYRGSKPGMSDGCNAYLQGVLSLKPGTGGGSLAVLASNADLLKAADPEALVTPGNLPDFPGEEDEDEMPF
jgi:hypothetical protein